MSQFKTNKTQKLKTLTIEMEIRLSQQSNVDEYLRINLNALQWH